MTKRAASKTTKKDHTVAVPADASSPRQLRVGQELADTTWRIAVPVLLFAGVGIVADRTWGSKPWVTLLGTAIGFVAAALLVKRQLARWPDMPVKPGSYERNRRPNDKEDQTYYDD